MKPNVYNKPQNNWYSQKLTLTEILYDCQLFYWRLGSTGYTGNKAGILVRLSSWGRTVHLTKQFTGNLEPQRAVGPLCHTTVGTQEGHGASVGRAQASCTSAGPITRPVR
ncbi:hypothetical protein RRG08_033912 [Elysia crispata]|uniref:Uncharacterized protein n=1 Tax=Elysia crispata TaxID=231223 RepID=A0AAE1B8M7_9GAST|nr:hypothetical protein RRG08_033912 [Elysia crispata]